VQSSSKHVARDISYSFSAQTRPGQAFIRSLENATGRLRLIKRADGYEREVGAGRDFWEVMVERYGLTLELLAGSLDNIPREGPLVVVANHPYGILDGLMMGHILSVVRGDFRILANRVFRKAEELNEVILPVSFDETKAGVALNLETRRTALKYLSDGGAIGVFPGGTVSTANKPFGRPLDPSWRSFTAKMIAKSDAHVVPIYFDGANSRLFQLASHLHTTLRMALLIKEFKSRVDAPVRLAVGQPLTRDALNPYLRDPRGMMDFLRAETYKLSSRPIDTSHYGFEFTEVHKPKSGQKNGHG
jgi:putative hemolysin